jgi:hypothetical protein
MTKGGEGGNDRGGEEVEEVEEEWKVVTGRKKGSKGVGRRKRGSEGRVIKWKE